MGAKKGEAGEDADEGASFGGGDTKFEEAVKLAIESGKISTSLLQRRLGVGYGRAAKLIDRMEQEGIVSASNGSKPRTVLISTEEYMRRFFGEEEGGAEGGE
jgi:S-DNA-T family DNA segregation ATPase FtsK/SpoIIIE